MSIQNGILPIAKNHAHRFLLALIKIYTLFAGSFTFFRFFVSDEWRVIAFLNTFAHLIWIPAFVFLPLVFMMRRWKIAVMLAPGIIAASIFYGGFFLPQQSPQDSSEDLIRVMTYNIWGWNALSDDAIDWLRTSGADVISIQELSEENREKLRSQLSEIYPHMRLHTATSVTQGQGILSKYPILEDMYWQHEWLPHFLGHQRTVIEVSPENTVVLYNTHLIHPGMNGSFFDPKWRSEEVAAMLPRITQEQGAVIWLGDFNMPELSQDYAAITQHFHDAYRRVGWGMGWTFPANGWLIPFLRLDYVFYNDGLRVHSARVLPNFGDSDHLPLLAEIEILR